LHVEVTIDRIGDDFGRRFGCHAGQCLRLLRFVRNFLLHCCGTNLLCNIACPFVLHIRGTCGRRRSDCSGSSRAELGQEFFLRALDAFVFPSCNAAVAAAAQLPCSQVDAQIVPSDCVLTPERRGGTFLNMSSGQFP
jgi:hypothetical protein